MLAVQKDYYDNIDNIVNFPGYNEPWNYNRQEWNVFIMTKRFLS